MPARSNRPGVDVVVPFAGSTTALARLASGLNSLALREDDTLTIVDNRPAGAPAVDGVLRAPDRQSSYFARNRGAAVGSNPWIVFIDADTEPLPDLAERYFSELPGDGIAVLAGGVIDEPLDPTERQPIAARYAMLRRSMGQEHTLLAGSWSYAQTANCAVRRVAFEAIGGFRDGVRSGGDADLCFRLRAGGWEVESREIAAVVHRSRRTMRQLLRQRARHGSGAAWLERQYPGAAPRARWLGLVKWTLESLVDAAVARARGRPDDAVVAVVEPLVKWAFEFGRLFPNVVDEP